jgi:hypothetical protein
MVYRYLPNIWSISKLGAYHKNILSSTVNMPHIQYYYKTLDVVGLSYNLISGFE